MILRNTSCPEYVLSPLYYRIIVIIVLWENAVFFCFFIHYFFRVCLFILNYLKPTINCVY